MHAILTSLGTDGDVLPYVGLGRALRRRGHRVTLVASSGYARRAAESGLDFVALLDQSEVDAALSHPDFWHPIKGVPLAAAWGVPHLRRHYDLLRSLCDASPDPVLVTSPAILPARILEEERSVPMASVVLQPWMLWSATEPPIMPAGLTLPRWAPWPAEWLYVNGIEVVGAWLIGRHLNRLREQLGLRPIRRVFKWWWSPRRIIGLFPEWYGPTQPAWPKQVRLAGFPREEIGDVGNAVAPDAPIAFTFGTGMRHATELFAACAAACERLGRRGVFVTRHAGQLPSPLPACVRHVEHAPFVSLFPSCAAVVHHGGVGTTAAALAAGTPQVVIPWAYDQFDNAARVERLGVGVGLRRSRRSADHIAQAVGRLLAPAVRDRCGEVASRCASDGDGLARGVDWVEQLAGEREPQVA